MNLEAAHDLITALANAGAKLAQGFRAAVEAMTPALEIVGQCLREAVKTISASWWCLNYGYKHAIAYKWAEAVHPEWVKIMRRTKKCRIRKKYADRIWREYLKGKGR